MQPLKRRASDLLKQIRSAYETLHIDAKAKELAAIDRQLADSNVWANVERAQRLSRESAALRAQIAPWQVLCSQTKRA